MLLSEYTAVFQAHAQKYPLMQPSDAVKLLFQSEFGGGHLISNKEACFNYLKAELLGSIGQISASPAFEYIGNDIFRVNFGSLTTSAYGYEEIFEDFLLSAQLIRGNTDVFYEKLGILEALTDTKLFGFDSSQLDDYLTSYKQAGCPMVSHSSIYRNAYKPAYRIVCAKFLEKRKLI